MIKLVASNEYECSGCGVCAYTCPCNAITMEKDDYGFLYASFDSLKCINCGKCHSVCPHVRSTEINHPIEVYAAISKCTDVFKSSSGGIFAALAKYVILNGGVVYGAVYKKKDERLIVKHIRASSLDELSPMRGSKYVQSYMEDIYKQIQNDINLKKRVLFCGTPCQCQAVKKIILNPLNYLITIDIVCHGVPSAEMFSSFISELENKYKCRISSFNFREKNKGWSGSCSIEYSKNGINKKKYLYPSEISYYSMFENCLIMRPSCYECKYATDSRVGDITVGDYWGIQKTQPELLSVNGGSFDHKKGISLLLVNTVLGKELLNEINKGIEKEVSTIEYVKKYNPQLSHPMTCNKDLRNRYLQVYSLYGYEKLDKMWRSKHLCFLIKRFFINRLPSGIKNLLKAHLNS